MSSQPHKLLLPFLFLAVLNTNLHGNSIESPAICPPFSCSGGEQIRYPFLRSDSSSSHCGYPNLTIYCDSSSGSRSSNYSAFVLLSNNYRYIIKNIDYTEKTLTLVDYNVFSVETCPWPEATVESAETLLPLELVRNESMNFYSGCSEIPPDSPLASCEGDKTGSKRTYLSIGSLYSGLPNLKCEQAVRVPMIDTAFEELNRDGNWQKAVQEGFSMLWYAPDDKCKHCELSQGYCTYTDGVPSQNFLCSCPDGKYHPRDCKDGPGQSSNERGKSSIKIKALIGSSVAVGAVLILILLLLYTKKLSFNSTLLWNKRTSNTQNVETFLRDYGSLGPKRYSYSDIKKITNSFKDKLGTGAFGAVYKGKLSDDSLVAVKVLSEFKEDGDDFINEVSSIGRTNHVNIVGLLGFCFEGSKRALVYEFMPNGSLEKFIYPKELQTTNSLDWEKLHQIALGIARGLEYLHRGCSTRILHLDIKPHNILLDENFCPKISDFGLAKLCPARESIISIFGARGTIGYIAPELCFRNIGGVSYKSDVYSYGMMILEMVGGRRNISTKVTNVSEAYYPEWIYKRIEQERDMGIGLFEESIDEEIPRKMILVGLWCIQIDPTARPSMSRVAEMLEGSIDGIVMPPKPFFDIPSMLGE